MKVAEIPPDLRVFLADGKALDCDEGDCEAGAVSLHQLEHLALRVFRAQTYGTPLAEADPHREEDGTYAVPGVDLIASCTGDYDPEGLLVWFPAEQSYGVCDTSHDYVLLFGSDVCWADIAASPARYINAQWAFEDRNAAPASFLAPWHHHQWNG